MKKLFSIIVALVLVSALFAGCAGTTEENPTEAPAETEAATEAATEAPTEEPSEETTEAQSDATEAPEATAEPETLTPFAEAVFDGDTVKNSNDNATMTINGNATVGTYEVKIGEKTYEATALRCTEAFDGITCKIPSLEWEEDMENFLFDGVAFEIFIQVDNKISSNGSLFANSNAGGFNLMLRGANSQIQFNIGTTDTNSADFGGSGYAYSQDPAGEEADTVNGVFGELMHLVAVFDAENNSAVVYLNGEKIEEAYYGGGDFKMGSAPVGEIGIGYNSGYSESLGALSPFTIVRARIYNKTLSADLVKEAYQESLALLTEK